MMNVTELKPSQMAAAIEDAIRSNVTVCVLSSPGMGKSDVIRQVARSTSVLEYFRTEYGTKAKPVKRVKLVDERVSTMDLTDWRGVPDIDREKQRTVWYPPAFLPYADDDPTVVFFDEITQVPPQCQSPLYQILLDKKLGTIYSAPPSARFIAAGNLVDDGTGVQKLHSALRDRMVVLYMKPDLDDWCRWAYQNGIAPVVIAFVRFRPTLFYKFDKNQWASPTARGWEFVSRIVTGSKITGISRDALIEGKIGPGPMLEFTAFERVFNDLPSIDAIKLNPDTAKLPNSPELTYAVSNALAHHATVGNLDRIAIYLERLPEEYGVFTMKVATRRDEKLSHTPAFQQWVMAHADAMN